MPFYDVRCLSCAKESEDVLTPVNVVAPCPSCGAATERIWRSRSTSVVKDECDIVQENGFHTPTRFTSKRELALALAAKGLEQRVRHVTIPGTDHSPYTTDWSRGSVDLKAAIAAVSEPRGKIHLPDVSEPDVPITWTVREWEPT